MFKKSMKTEYVGTSNNIIHGYEKGIGNKVQYDIVELIHNPQDSICHNCVAKLVVASGLHCWHETSKKGKV